MTYVKQTWANGAVGNTPVSATRLGHIEDGVQGVSDDLDLHKADTLNPHGVTKTQVGLGNVDNISAANLRDRTTHTGQQLASTISDLPEAVQDIVGAMLVSGGMITLSYDDTTGVVTLTGTGTDAETVRDTIGAAIIGTQGITVGINDPADTITLGVSGLTISQVTGLQAAIDSINSAAAAQKAALDLKASLANIALFKAAGLSLARSAVGSLFISIADLANTERPSSIWGAGFQNCFAMADPSITAQAGLAGVCLSGGDVAGTHISFDAGRTWIPANTGKLQTADLKTVAIVFDRVTANKVWLYASNGKINNNSGVQSAFSGTYAALYSGIINASTKSVTWTKVCDNSTATALALAQADGSWHPRQTGRMMVADPLTANRVYVGSRDGVLLLSGTAVTQKARAGSYVTGMMLSPDSDATSTNVYMSANAYGASPGVSKISGIGLGQTQSIAFVTGTGTAPQNPQGVVAVLEGATVVLYVADGEYGVKRHNGTGWSDITPPGMPGGITSGTTVFYKSVDAVRLSTGTTRVLVGHDGQDNTIAKLAWSDDGGTTWTILTDSDSIYTTAGSPLSWWLPTAYSYYGLKQSTGGFDCAQAFIRRDDPSYWYTVGRSGPWRRILGQFSSKWHPAVNGLNTVVSYGVATDPTNPYRIAEADVDWTCLTSEDRFYDSPKVQQPANDDTRGIAFDDAGGLWLGLSSRNIASTPVANYNTNGEVWYNSDPYRGGSWVNQGLQAAIGTNDFSVRGLAVTRHTDNDLVILAFCVSTTIGHGGIWRKKGTGAWARVSAAGEGNVSSSWNKIRVVWHPAQPGHAYAYDPLAGLYRSTDYGLTWTNIFPILPGSVYRYAGDVVCDPTRAGRVYLTLPGAVWKISNAHDGTMNAGGTNATGTAVATNVNATSTVIPSPGAVTVDRNGVVYVAAGPTSSTSAGLFRSTDDGVSWTDVSTARWKAQALFVYGMAATSSSRTVYAACDGNGVIAHSLDYALVDNEVFTADAVDALIAGITTGYQPSNANLTAISALVSAADKLPYFTGAGAAAVTTLSAFMRTLLDDPDAATAQATLGVSTTGFSRSLLPTNALFETMPRVNASAANVTVTSGTERGTAIYLLAGTVIASVTFISGSTAMVTPTNQYFALRDSSGTVLAVTADDTTNAWGANAAKTLALSYTVPTSGWYYLCRNISATTAPTMSGITMPSGVSGLAPYRAASFGSRTTPPTVGSTVAPTSSTGAEYGYVS